MKSFFPLELKLSDGDVLYSIRHGFFDGHNVVFNEIGINLFTSGTYVIFKSWDDCVDYMKHFDIRGFEARMYYGYYYELLENEMKNLGLEYSNEQDPKYPYCYTLVFKIEYEELENVTKTVFVTTANEVRTKICLKIN
jgi:hypothetical protein